MRHIDLLVMIQKKTGMSFQSSKGIKVKCQFLVSYLPMRELKGRDLYRALIADDP